MKFQDQLYELRKQKGLSQEQLAEQCGVSRQAVSKWENGSANPDLNNIKTLASVFHVSTDVLLGYQDKIEMYSMEPIHHRYSREYTSSLCIGRIPLVHICFGFGRRMDGKCHIAKGIIAIGNVSVGVIAIGFMSAGVLSFGILALSLIFAFGCLSMSYLAMGALAIGYIAIGALAIGVYSIGALSIGYVMSIGALSYGVTAIGPQGTTYGDTIYYLSNSGIHNNTCVLSSSGWLQMLDDGKLPYIIEFILKHIPICN